MFIKSAGTIMEKAKGRKKILYSSIAMIIISIISIPILCVLIRFINPLRVNTSAFNHIVLYAALSALIYQLILIVGAICGLILCDVSSKYQIILIFGIVLEALAIIIAIALLNYAYIMIPTIVSLGFYIKGAFDNKITVV
jgi:hypothetical protein